MGKSNDQFEQEADRVAEQVMRMTAGTHHIGDSPVGASNHGLQRKCACGGTPGRTGECERCGKKRLSLQRRAIGGREAVGAPPSVHEVISSPGTPLDSATRSVMEPRFGYDFSNVRIHSNVKAAKSAREVGAHAYTVGNSIVFGAGLFAAQTHQGQRLLAHELAHVVQQGSAKQTTRPQPIVQKTSRPQVQRSLVLDSTISVCRRQLQSRNIKVSRGGLRAVLVLRPLDTDIVDCQNHQFWVTLTKSVDWGFDDDITTCESQTGGNRSFSFARLSTGTYYLTINRAFDHPYCCIEGDILVFDEPVSADSSGCIRDKDPSAMDIVHGALDLLGFIPALGAIPDGINAGIYALEGDWANAGLSAVAMVPLWGDGVKLGAIAGKNAIKISEKAAVRLGEEGIAKGLKEVKAASKVEKATVEATGQVGKAEKEAVSATATGEKKAVATAEKKTVAKTIEERIAECLAIYAAYDALGDCLKCKGTDTPAERARKIACLTAEIAGRRQYLEKDCDDVLQGSIDKKKKGGDPKGGHARQLVEKMQSLAKCATLPTT